MADIISNWQKVLERVQKAANRVGRRPEDIQVVAVSKGVKIHRIAPLIESGVRSVGENRIQEALPKYRQAPWRDQVEWHFIGHLQTNKVRDCLEFASLIHSVDRLRLVKVLDQRAQALGISKVNILLQVNVSGEESKFGLAPDAVPDLLEQIGPYERVFVQGLMTMAPYEEEPENTRPCFRNLRILGEKLSNGGFSRFTMKYLSMGMTNDFEIAVEEGANLLRIGSAIFKR
ncbi:MAG: YggS family pyridoxal phosphate-dependent enzyme [Firmicutes bacterium]|nr:YggS family pyridoxal phosphate-dependent enzyme [Bacillota bacterium]